jgi:hypothetical protein
MSATTLREPRSAGAAIGGGAREGARSLPGRAVAALRGLRGRFGAIRLPAYISAFETEHLATLAESDECPRGAARHPSTIA